MKEFQVRINITILSWLTVFLNIYVSKVWSASVSRKRSLLLLLSDGGDLVYVSPVSFISPTSLLRYRWLATGHRDGGAFFVRGVRGEEQPVQVQGGGVSGVRSGGGGSGVAGRSDHGPPHHRRLPLRHQRHPHLTASARRRCKFVLTPHHTTIKDRCILNNTHWMNICILEKEFVYIAKKPIYRIFRLSNKSKRLCYVRW